MKQRPPRKPRKRVAKPKKMPPVTAHQAGETMATDTPPPQALDLSALNPSLWPYDQTGAQIARETAAWQRRFIAAADNAPVGPLGDSSRQFYLCMDCKLAMTHTRP